VPPPGGGEYYKPPPFTVFMSTRVSVLWGVLNYKQSECFYFVPATRVFFFLRKQSCQLLIHRPNKRFHQKNALFTWNKITHRAGTLLVFKICGWAETKLGRWVVEMRRTRWFGFGEGTETDPADQWDRKRKTKLTVHPEVCSFTNQIVERSPSGLSTPLKRLTRNSCLGKR